MLPTKFRVRWPFCSREEAKNRFLRWPPSWISDCNSYSYFDQQVIPMRPTSFLVSWLFVSGKEAKKKEFQYGRNGGDFGFPIVTLLASFDLQVTHMLPTKFRVSWLFCSGEEEKNEKISRWPPWHPLCISIGNF